MPIGQSTETKSVDTVRQTMTLDLSLDDFAAQREALIQKLAIQYGVDPSLITLEASSVRRRARALQSGGGLELTITTPCVLFETAAVEPLAARAAPCAATAASNRP